MPKEQTGIAGEFWFFSQLHILGYEAYITFGNTKGIDISVKLDNGVTLTFDVKSKENFGGSFQYLDNIPIKNDHFVVFVNLQSHKNNSNNHRLLLAPPDCYIVKSSDLNQIAFHWTASTGTKGYGFEAKLLYYLKEEQKKSITEKNINDFIKRHDLNTIDFTFYQSKIWSIADFENNYYKLK